MDKIRKPSFLTWFLRSPMHFRFEIYPPFAHEIENEMETSSAKRTARTEITSQMKTIWSGFNLIALFPSSLAETLWRFEFKEPICRISAASFSVCTAASVCCVPDSAVRSLFCIAAKSTNRNSQTNLWRRDARETRADDRIIMYCPHVRLNDFWRNASQEERIRFRVGRVCAIFVPLSWASASATRGYRLSGGDSAGRTLFLLHLLSFRSQGALLELNLFAELNLFSGERPVERGKASNRAIWSW